MSVDTNVYKEDETGEPIIRVRNLQTAFFTDKEIIRAVDGISFDLFRGKTVGIVGESGSGKSVTARSIMGLVDDPGKVLAGSSIQYTELNTVETFAEKFRKNTVNISKLSKEYDSDQLLADKVGKTAAELGYNDTEQVGLAELAAHGYLDDTEIIDETDSIFITEGSTESPKGGFIELTRLGKKASRLMRGKRTAMIFQDPLTSLNPVYTVGNQIKEALELHQNLKGKEATKAAVDLLESVGIPDSRRRLTEYPHQFSGGMRQRAIIAMALACDPDVLIADEPTTALDVTIQAQILELLQDLQQSKDLAIMFITHDMGVIAEISDMVNVMYAGEVVESTNVEDIFAQPKHPYTVGLLNSIPARQTGDKLSTIEGNVPTANKPAESCRFAPRCPKAFEECNKVPPQLVNTEADKKHRVACLLYPEGIPAEQAVKQHRQMKGEER